MALTEAERLKQVHQNALAEFDRIQSAVRVERQQCLQDRRFYSIAGAQWEGLEEQFKNKPKVEVNKIHLAIIRIFNEYRNNRISVRFASKDGEDREKLAETCGLLYRADEQESTAEEAYDNAFEEAVGGGFGAWRLRTCYEDETDDENERLRIRIDPIYDADSSVFFDRDAKRQDKKDAKRCYVLTSITPEAYEEEYGEDPSSWNKAIQQVQYDWFSPNVVYIAELYLVEEKKETVHIYRGLDGTEQKYRDSAFAEDETLEKELAATGFREVRQKKVKTKKVHKYIMSGSKILEDCGYIEGSCIPIVPVYAKRWYIDNVERCMGHVRLARDAQRLKNMQLSKLAEISAISSVQKPILTPEQIRGHQTMWSKDNIDNYPYLLVNPITDAMGNTTVIGPTSFTQSPAIPPAMAALLQITEQDIQDVLGNQQAGEQMQSNISGKVVELIQNRLDMQSYIYISNFAKAIKRSGEIWLSMAKEILVEENRKMKGLNEHGLTEKVTLMRPLIDQNGKMILENDLTEADFDVSVEVGPSSTSKRQSTVRSLNEMMQITQDPETLQVLSSMAMMNMEGEGISDARTFFRNKLIRMGVVKPTEEELKILQEEQANQQPDPNAQFLAASADNAQAQAAKARADTVLTIAKTKKTQADTLETMSNIDIANQDQIMRTLDVMKEDAQGEMPSAL